MKSLLLTLFTVLLFGTTKAANNLEINTGAFLDYGPTNSLNINILNNFEKQNLTDVSKKNITVITTFTDNCGVTWTATTTCSCTTVAQAHEVQQQYIYDHTDQNGCTHTYPVLP